jgi:hypothetical protein
MAIICPPGATPAQPGATAAWSFSSSRFGKTVTRKTPRGRAGEAAWTYPTPLLGGMSLYQFRKAYFAYISALWKDGTLFDKASFQDLYSSLPYTNTNGELVSPNAFSLFKHFCESAMMFQAVAHYLHVAPNFVTHGWEATAGDAEPAPGAITAAAWDGKDTWSISVSNYALDEPYGVEIYATPPNVTVANAKHLFQIAYIEIFTTNPWNSAHAQPTTSSILRPWPKGSECLFGLRVLENDPRFYLPSPISAVLIEIG